MKLTQADKNTVVMMIITVLITIVSEIYQLPGALTFVLVIIVNGLWLLVSPFSMSNDV